MSKNYPDMFCRFAFSGQAKCHKCKITIKKGQNVFEFQGNIYHDICSQDLKGREKLEEGKASATNAMQVWKRAV